MVLQSSRLFPAHKISVAGKHTVVWPFGSHSRRCHSRAKVCYGPVHPRQLWVRREVVITAAAGGGEAVLRPSAGLHHANNAVYRLYDALNQRDVPALAACFAADVQYNNLAFIEGFRGATAVARFYQESMAALPVGAQIVLEQHAGGLDHGSAATSMAVVWRLVLPDSNTTVSRGIAFCTLDAGGRISSILDSPELPVKLSARGLTMFGPLVQGLAGSMLPAVQELGRAVQQGVDLLLQPLEGIMAQTDAAADSSAGASGAASSNGNGTGSSATGSWSSTSSNSATPGQWGGPATSSSSTSRWAPAGAVSAAGPGANRQQPAPSAPPGSTTAFSQMQPPPLPPSAAAAAGGSSSAAWRAVVAAASGSGPVGGPAGAGQQVQPNFSGLWVKVPERSDIAGYEAALDVLGLSGLQKVTARLIEGLEVQQSRENFTVSFVTVVPFFKVTEDVPLDGGSTQLGRRDLRFGRQTTAARSVPGGVLVEMSWGPPMAGSLTERYSLLEDGCLCVEAVTSVGDRSATSKTIYMRSGGSRDELLSDSKRRSPSVAAVLQQQRQQGLDV